MSDQTHAAALLGQSVGNYRITSLIGSGGMGAVYRGEHPLIGKKVAIKVLHPEIANDPTTVNRFFGEARAVNEIGHPGIVNVLDFGHLPGGGPPYLVMELLEGQSLADLLRHGPLEPAGALSVVVEIADALAAAHAHGIIHRDLKPDNVFLAVEAGATRVKILDFGIAKLGGDGPTSSRTRSGVVIGTPHYMSPEQCEGRGRIDARSDVYALGVVLYEMLVGRPPFLGEGYGELIVQHLTRAPAPPSHARPGLPAALDALVLRALAKRADERYPSMVEVRDAALALLGGAPAPAPAPSLRRRALVAGLLAVALGVAGGALALRGSTPAVALAADATPVAAAVDAGPPAVVARPDAAPPRVETVALTVECAAPGATVSVEGYPPVRAGETLAVPRGDRELAVVVAAPGFRERRTGFVPRGDKVIEVVLKPRAAVAPPPLTPTCPPGDPDCVLAPR